MAAVTATDRRRTPTRACCPVCGRCMKVQCLPGHAGGQDCVLRLYGNHEQHHDPQRGPLALAAARAMHEALKGLGA